MTEIVDVNSFHTNYSSRNNNSVTTITTFSDGTEQYSNQKSDTSYSFLATYPGDNKFRMFFGGFASVSEAVEYRNTDEYTSFVAVTLPRSLSIYPGFENVDINGDDFKVVVVQRKKTTTIINDETVINI